MIQKVEMYQTVCDRCGMQLPRVWKKELTANAYALEKGWREIDGHLYCPDCVEYDEETDSYKPKGKDD